MPTFTAFQTFPHRAGVAQFAVDLTAEWEKLNDCRIGGVMPRASLRVFIPGWRIRAKTFNEARFDADKEGCVSSRGTKDKMDRVVVTVHYVLEYNVISIPTPWGSIGGITLQTLEVSCSMAITPDGGVERLPMSVHRV